MYPTLNQIVVQRRIDTLHQQADEARLAVAARARAGVDIAETAHAPRRSLLSGLRLSWLRLVRRGNAA